ncbi:hypothetical protein Tsp_01989 [Trichinella spiralis]|uniref:hypothetical protein n=1 Tax=Trichinella spiralis TaxID=6334 RepID=UPI0001EFB8ED|nr:hypothetical protein Tsp_01989 [Trichinella spiralis]
MLNLDVMLSNCFQCLTNEHFTFVVVPCSAVTLPPSSSRLHIGRPGEHIRKPNPFRTNDPVKLAICSTVTVPYPQLVVAQEADASASDFIRLVVGKQKQEKESSLTGPIAVNIHLTTSCPRGWDCTFSRLKTRYLCMIPAEYAQCAF